ncbi:hypothetical protein GPROT1_01344 [Gammaproteobacteria bacterium]|nr:hypothetical protein GPROT1_01344 [Gammaproteobacteria bacterium]
MNLQELFTQIDKHPLPVLAYFIGLPLLAWAAGHWYGGGPLYKSPLRWLYSAILYGVCVPGMVAAVVVADNLAQGRLLQVGVFSQLLPMLSMLVSFGLIRQQANPADIPGFRRVTGFVVLLTLTALALFLLMRTRIWVLFGGGIGTLLVLMAGLFLSLKWAYDRAFGAGR